MKIKLTVTERTRLREARKRATSARSYRCLQAVFLAGEGASASRIADVFELAGLAEIHLSELALQRWKLTSEMLCSRHTSKMLLPRSASRKMRILSSVVYRLPFISQVSFDGTPDSLARAIYMEV